ncbi:MAG TPA: hypothetical protein VN281_08585 [Verrucomicrobiae bacterium]|jgi:hypothetical protein|nr:hypothetical protein [Verrucomicrobiae bacterium]
MDPELRERIQQICDATSANQPVAISIHLGNSVWLKQHYISLRWKNLGDESQTSFLSKVPGTAFFTKVAGVAKSGVCFQASDAAGNTLQFEEDDICPDEIDMEKLAFSVDASSAD